MKGWRKVAIALTQCTDVKLISRVCSADEYKGRLIPLLRSMRAVVIRQTCNFIIVYMYHEGVGLKPM